MARIAGSPIVLTQATLGSESGLCSPKHSHWQVEQALANSERSGQGGIPDHQPGNDTQPALDSEYVAFCLSVLPRSATNPTGLNIFDRPIE